MAEVVPIIYRDASRENVLARFREEGVWKGEVIQQRRDGTTVDILSSVTMIRDSAGQPTGVIAVNRDITERKQAEERETRLGRILEHSLNEIYIFDADTLHFLEVNRGARENVGYSFDELRTLTPLDLKPEFTPETFAQLLEPLRTGAREKIEFTTVHRRKDGSLYPVEVHLQLSTWQRSTVFVAIILDITKRKQAEQAMRTSEERYRRVVEDQTEYVMRWLPDGTVLFANDSYCRYFGVTSGEIERANVFDLIPEVDHVRLRQKIASLRPESPLVREEHPVTRPDGSRGWHDWNDRAILDEAGRIVEYQSVGRDITERKQAEEALQVSEERNRALLDGIPDMMFRLRTDGTFLDYKAESEEELAVPPEAIIGSTLAQSPMPAAIVDDMMRCVEQAMTRGKVQTYEYELSVPMGLQTYEARFVRSGADEVVCIVRNVTERKRAEAEQERLIDELEARNAELERFTYTVSHDLKTPLVTIKGFLGLLMKDVKAGHEEAFEHDIEQISNAADQMARLLAELLELSRIGHVINPSEEVSLTTLARDALKLLAEPITERGITVEIAPDLPVVFGDKIRLLEVLQNLLDNAVKFMGDQPEPHIKVASRFDNGNTICYIEDNGIGIAKAYQEQVFGLFNRLNTTVDGTGIGLALVKRIIEMHGGGIWIESEGDGHGSTFCFTLPE